MCSIEQDVVIIVGSEQACKPAERQEHYDGNAALTSAKMLAFVSCIFLNWMHLSVDAAFEFIPKGINIHRCLVARSVNASCNGMYSCLIWYVSC